MDRTDDERGKAAKPAASGPLPKRSARPAQDPSKTRADRRAEALRANLRRRKAQARGRRESGGGGPDGPGA